MLANGVKETTTTTGTGTVTLAAVTGAARFSQAFSVGDIASYAIKDGDNWEWGIGTVSAGNTLARTAITATLVSGTYTATGATAITLSGSAEVLCAEHTGNTIAGVTPRNGTRFIAGHLTNQVLTSSTGTSTGTVALMPFTAPRRKFQLNSLGLLVTTLGASGTVVLGLYSDNAGVPGTLLTSCTIDSSTTGRKSASVSTALRLIPGQMYWVALLGLTTTCSVLAIPAGEAIVDAGFQMVSSQYQPFGYYRITGQSSLPSSAAGALQYYGGVPFAIEVIES